MGSPRAMFVSREATRAEVHANAGSSQSLSGPVSAVLLTRFRGAAAEGTNGSSTRRCLRRMDGAPLADRKLPEIAES